MSAEDLVLMAVVGAPHGVKGEVRVRSHTSDPLSIAGYGPLRSRDGRVFQIVHARPQKTVLVVRFKGVSDRTAAEALNGTELFVEKSALGEPDEDEFFHADLVGLEVSDTTGAALGRVVALHDFGAGDIVEIGRHGNRTVMIPFTRAAVPVVDIKTRKLVVDLLAAGLTPDGDQDGERD